MKSGYVFIRNDKVSAFFFQIISMESRLGNDSYKSKGLLFARPLIGSILLMCLYTSDYITIFPGEENGGTNEYRRRV